MRDIISVFTYTVKRIIPRLLHRTPLYVYCERGQKNKNDNDKTRWKRSMNGSQNIFISLFFVLVIRLIRLYRYIVWCTSFEHFSLRTTNSVRRGKNFFFFQKPPIGNSEYDIARRVKTRPIVSHSPGSCILLVPYTAATSACVAVVNNSNTRWHRARYHFSLDGTRTRRKKKKKEKENSTDTMNVFRRSVEKCTWTEISSEFVISIAMLSDVEVMIRRVGRGIRIVFSAENHVRDLK